MRIGRKILWVFAALGILIITGIGVVLRLALKLNAQPENSPATVQIILITAFVLFALLASLVLAWHLVDGRVTRTLQKLSRDILKHLHVGIDAQLQKSDYPDYGDLIESLNAGIYEFNMARHRMQSEIDNAIRQKHRQANHLASALEQLHEGVIICNMSHEILLYNRRALTLLRVAGELGLARPLFSLTNSQPFLHSLERLQNRLKDRRDHGRGLSMPFVSTTFDGSVTFDSKMTLMVDENRNPTGYVFTFEDRTKELAELIRRDHLLRRATDHNRKPLANLCSAAEILTDEGKLSATKRRVFENIIYHESRKLAEHLEQMDHEYSNIVSSHWPMSPTYSANLLNVVIRRLAENDGIDATMTGTPQWLLADSYSLVEMFYHLTCLIIRELSVTGFQFRAKHRNSTVFIEIVWSGRALDENLVSAQLDYKLDPALGGITVQDVLDRHGSNIWSVSLDTETACLRLPLTRATIPAAETGTDPRSNLPNRPEFFDFDLLQPGFGSSPLMDQPLTKLTYVVFDTETTGLSPAKGDEMVQIAGVRMVNGRILTGETFSRLINPGRLIPETSIRFHGITDAMVKDQPTARDVLKDFRRFTENAVLVAHNAAFDMAFLKQKETVSGCRFDHPVLDTLLLSVFLDDHQQDHTLDAIAARLGVEIPPENRHTALGDAIATAEIFLVLIKLLAARGIHTLSEAIKASEKMTAIRKQQKQFQKN